MMPREAIFRRFAVLILPAITLPILSACTTAGAYPSLGRRDAERIERRALPAPGEAPPAPALPPPSADLVTRLDGLVASARSAHNSFSGKQASAERAVAAASGASPASDSWVAAQVALSALQASRSAAMTALAELDTLYAAEKVASAQPDSPSIEAIGAARTQVEAWIAEEDAVVTRLTGRLRA